VRENNNESSIMNKLLKSIIGKVVPERIKNIYRKIEPMLTKYNINNRKNWRRILMFAEMN